MKDPRKLMIKALAAELVPELRRRGFKGTFPHFNRLTERAMHLLMIQFNRYGGSFVVEIATAPLNGFTYRTGWQVPPDKVNVGHTKHRLRLGSAGEQSDHWFAFDTDPSELAQESRVEVARGVVPLLDRQAEPWWLESEKQHPR